MRYIKLFLSSILAMVIAAIVIWSGIFIVLFSALATPLIAWWVKRRRAARIFPARKGKSKKKQTTPEGYKVIEAEFEIIEK